VNWSDLSREQRCVLVGAATSALLQDLLTSWSPGSSWDELMIHVPRLARAVVEMADADLVEVYLSASSEDEGERVLKDDLATVVDDPSNWMTDDGPSNIVELVTTDAAGAVLNTRGTDDLHSFRTPNPDEEP